MMAAINLAIDPAPPPPSQAKLDAKERRAAGKEFEQRVAGAKEAASNDAGKVKPVASARPLSQKYDAIYHR
jgi:hypothetical protein